MIIENGFFNRMKKLQIIRMLGTGMDIGELNDYAYEICFLLIQNIFMRELSENNSRTRDDMIFITEEILSTMKLTYTREIVERIFGASSNPNSPINSFIILETTGSPIHPKAKLAIVIPN